MYGSYLEKLVNNVDGHVESLLEQLELGVDLHQPVNQQAPHLPGDGTAAVRKSKYYTHTVMTKSRHLRTQEILPDGETILHPPEVGVDSGGVLDTQLRIVLTLSRVNICHSSRNNRRLLQISLGTLHVDIIHFGLWSFCNGFFKEGRSESDLVCLARQPDIVRGECQCAQSSPLLTSGQGPRAERLALRANNSHGRFGSEGFSTNLLLTIFPGYGGSSISEYGSHLITHF